ncbi:hypothetical protein NUW54_g10773 [Trametes sanguinea]|uniref:Uncharacterized protein n=1 Tax=Trametes sanguinea TaxID=158606 RepID=A0ACC1NTT9_9APHY|nr:hypothetical protein NUW54_g10773 [Trametes sanguinea]
MCQRTAPCHRATLRHIVRLLIDDLVNVLKSMLAFPFTHSNIPQEPNLGGFRTSVSDQSKQKRSAYRGLFSGWDLMWTIKLPFITQDPLERIVEDKHAAQKLT